VLRALLVGIDAYLPPVNALYGCRNDIAALEQYLTERAGDGLDLRTLYDADATRANVTTAFREHLGGAGPGDVALFAYAGHGSQEPAPADVAHLEETGRIQTLVLHDCGRRVDGKLQRPLADKELAVLIAQVADGGAHVVIVLDCCNSGGGTRDPYMSVRGWVPDPDVVEPAQRDLVAELATARPTDELLPGTVKRWAAPAAPHVALSACHSWETAKESRAGDVTRGAFSVSLGEALDALGSRATYRSLLATVRSKVGRRADEQHPELFPLDVGGLGDSLFLDGTITPIAASFTVSRGFDGWQVDAGLVHGLRPPDGDDAFVLSCRAPDGSPAGDVRVVAVDVGVSEVEPLGWEPDDVAYAAVISDVPLPPAEVAFDLTIEGSDPAHLAAVRDALAAAIASAGAAGDASPFVRLAPDGGASTGALRLRVGAPAVGVARLARADGSAVTADVDVADDAGARLAVANLEHVARWEQIRALGDHPSPLRDAVALDVYEAIADEGTRPPDRQRLAGDGGHRFSYRREGDRWVAPRIYLDLRNTSDADLFVAVLDLTDRYRCSAVLPTVRLAAGHTYALWDGRSIPIELPADRPVQPGAAVRDWLKVVASDVDFDAVAFDLAALGEPVEVQRSTTRSRNTLERLAAKAARRDIGGPPPPVARWTATTIPLETVIPT